MVAKRPLRSRVALIRITMECFGRNGRHSFGKFVLLHILITMKRFSRNGRHSVSWHLVSSSCCTFRLLWNASVVTEGIHSVSSSCCRTSVEGAHTMRTLPQAPKETTVRINAPIPWVFMDDHARSITYPHEGARKRSDFKCLSSQELPRL